MFLCAAAGTWKEAEGPGDVLVQFPVLQDEGEGGVGAPHSGQGAGYRVQSLRVPLGDSLGQDGHVLPLSIQPLDCGVRIAFRLQGRGHVVGVHFNPQEGFCVQSWAQPRHDVNRQTYSHTGID